MCGEADAYTIHFTHPLMMVKTFCRISVLLEHSCHLNCSHIQFSPVQWRDPTVRICCDQWLVIGVISSGYNSILILIWFSFLAPNRDIWHFTLIIRYCLCEFFSRLFTTINTFTVPSPLPIGTRGRQMVSIIHALVFLLP